MTMKWNALALAAATLVAACGGGADSSDALHAQAAGAMRAKAQSAAAQAVRAEAVTPTAAAEQLMDFAESVTAFKAYFPQHQTTQTFGPFKYRAYSSGVLLGVVVTDGDPDYKPVGSVWVMGGEFGNAPLKVGMVTDFITPTDPGTGGPTGPNNGCADLSKADTPGTRSVIVYSYSGVITGTQTVDTLVGNSTTFEGHQAVESVTKTTGSNTVAGQTVPIETEVKSYLKRTGDAEVTHYGSVYNTSSSTTLQGITTTNATQSKSVYTPPWVDRWYGLAIGQSATQSWTDTTTMTTTTTISIPGLPPQTTTNTNTSTSSSSLTVKYVGRESVTVPAGTYNACKFEHSDTDSGTTSVTTQWVIVGVGLPVKMTSTVNGQTQTIQATSITLNGQRL